MTTGEWIGLVMSLAGLVIPLLVYAGDLWLFATGRLDISESVWADLARWRAGLGPFPKRIVWLPASLAAAGLVSGVGLFIHFIT